MTADITLDQSMTFQETFTWTDDSGNPRDLTGYAAELRMYSDYGSEAQQTVLTFKSTGGGSANTSMTLGGNTGVISIRAELAALQALTFYSGWYILQVLAPDAVTVTKVSDGAVIVERGEAY